MSKLLILKHHLLTSRDNLESDCKYHIGMNFWVALNNKFKNNNFEIITFQDFINSPRKFKNYQKFIISNEPKLFEILICKIFKINMFLTLCGESPINSFSYHFRLNYIAFFYKNIWGFSGVKKLLIFNKYKFHNLNWPIEEYSLTKFFNFNDRKLLAYIASAKSKYPYSSRTNYKFISKLIRKPRFYFNLIQSLIFSKLLGSDLSAWRFNFIKKLSTKEGFFLFGRGWDIALKEDPFYKGLNNFNFPVEVVNKFNTLCEFKFCLCLENTNFPGYHTEKLLDSIKSGCIPVYLGSNTISDIIPKDCYIDAKNYPNPFDLYEYLENMRESSWLNYYNAIKNFTTSDTFKVNFLDTSIAIKFYNLYLKQYS
jgi:hypothetical protein